MLTLLQGSVGTERPKKGKRTTKIWCTQSFAKDDTIGRVSAATKHCPPHPGSFERREGTRACSFSQPHVSLSSRGNITRVHFSCVGLTCCVVAPACLPCRYPP